MLVPMTPSNFAALVGNILKTFCPTFERAMGEWRRIKKRVHDGESQDELIAELSVKANAIHPGSVTRWWKKQ